jgi:hypothetical protein
VLGNRLRLFPRKRRQPPGEEAFATRTAADGAPAAEAAADEPGAAGDSSLGYELLLYGNEQILRGSDNGTLVAFAAIAFQQIRGRGALHNDVGCGFLMLSVLLCAVVHFAIGYAYVGRARRMIGQRHETAAEARSRRAYLGLAWFSTFVQFVFVIVGTVLILIETAPPWLQRWLEDIFG